MIYGLSNSAQFEPLLWAAMQGLLLGLLWDVLRFFRRIFPPGKGRLFAEDVLFFLMWSVFTFVLCYVTNYGQIRTYIIFAQLFGFFAWYCLPGRLTARFADLVLRYIRKCVIVPYLFMCSRLSSLFEKLFRKKPKKIQKKGKNKEKQEKNIAKLQKKTCK